MATNPWEIDDMPHTIARAVAPLLQLVLPSRGRHRSAGSLPVTYGAEAGPRWIHGMKAAG
ncbi:hypothetical protein EST92_13630 [Streptomyces sp. TM32]|nr:hypothetical protein EST92_13630 [Streptomyces sp. TM32]